MVQSGEKNLCQDSAAGTDGCEGVKKQFPFLLRSGQALVFVQEAHSTTIENFCLTS
jgi:hypothetical protein